MEKSTKDEKGNGMSELLEEFSSEKGVGKCPTPSARLSKGSSSTDARIFLHLPFHGL